jgi:hypothetical protein
MSSRLAATREQLSYQGVSLGIMALIASAALVIASNATRHGAARRMHVTAGVASNHIFVEARDNGTGPTAHVQQGIGLVGVLRDGLTVNTDANGWCTVSGLLPLSSALTAQRYARH